MEEERRSDMMDWDNTWWNVKTSVGSQPPKIKINVEDDEMIRNKFWGESVEPQNHQKYKTPLNREERPPIQEQWGK